MEEQIRGRYDMHLTGFRHYCEMQAPPADDDWTEVAAAIRERLASVIQRKRQHPRFPWLGHSMVAAQSHRGV